MEFENKLLHNYKIYYENISFLDDKKVYEKNLLLLSPDRRDKIEKYIFDKDKKLSLLADILLRNSLKDMKLINNMCDNFEYIYNEYNKPYLKIKNEKFSENKNQVFFNFSHSGEYAICVISNQEIGCDIEEIKDIDLNIAKRFFTKNEYENICHQSSDEKKKNLFYRYWVLKESFIKAIGQGLKMPLNEFEILLENDKILVKQDMYDTDFLFEELEIADGYKSAVCIKNE